MMTQPTATPEREDRRRGGRAGEGGASPEEIGVVVIVRDGAEDLAANE